MLSNEDIARIAHEINRAYCEALGDNSQPTWRDAPSWQKKSAINGVRFHLLECAQGPAASHESWMAEKLADGWTYGEVKDPDAKTHPCLVPFDQLPPEQKAKDYLFAQVVNSLRPYASEWLRPQPFRIIGLTDNHDGTWKAELSSLLYPDSMWLTVREQDCGGRAPRVFDTLMVVPPHVHRLIRE